MRDEEVAIYKYKHGDIIEEEAIMLPNPAGGKYGPTSGSPNLYPPGTEHLRPASVEWPPRDPVVKKAEAEASESVS